MYVGASMTAGVDGVALDGGKAEDEEADAPDSPEVRVSGGSGALGRDGSGASGGCDGS